MTTFKLMQTPDTDDMLVVISNLKDWCLSDDETHFDTTISVGDILKLREYLMHDIIKELKRRGDTIHQVPDDFSQGYQNAVKELINLMGYRSEK